MNKTDPPEKNKKLKLMVKLQYGEDYTGLFYLCPLVTIFILFFGGTIAFVVPPLFFLYLVVVQLYSGIGLGIWDSLWAGRHHHPVLAKYKQEIEPTPFYINVYTCLVLGILASLVTWQLYVNLYR